MKKEGQDEKEKEKTSKENIKYCSNVEEKTTRIKAKE